jgi:iron transport multicopper oxidase
MRRDTFLIYENGYAVVRFKVDNPGVTFFHCHIDWHAEAGMAITFIEAPTQLQKLNLKIPDSHRQACQQQGIKMRGNAAGNADKWLDLTGAPTEPPLNNWGALVTPPGSKSRMGKRRG